ncbi:MAG TPA: cytochrome c [Alphaproteobacteria bacterium]|nr:cytochrome c [Alphaproteobacteria bacterium]
MMKRGSLLAAIALLALIASGGGASAADAKEGKRIARIWCVDCHQVGTELREGRTAPTFKEISERIPMSETYMDTWLNNPNPPMHRFRLTSRMVSDIIAYLKTLQKK